MTTLQTTSSRFAETRREGSGVIEAALRARRERLLPLDAPGPNGESWADDLLAVAAGRPATPEELLLAREAIVARWNRLPVERERRRPRNCH